MNNPEHLPRLSLILLLAVNLSLPFQAALGQSAPQVTAAGEDVNAQLTKPLRKQELGKQTGPAPCLSWIDPGQSPRAVLLCIHGLGLYNRTYKQFGRRMSRLGFATYAIDVRGFGSWMEAKGKEEVDFNACLEDVRATVELLHKLHPNLPVFVVGESMGGAIALQAAAKWPKLIDGLISSVPAAERFKQKKTELKVALHMLRGPNKEFDIGSQVVNQATQKPELRAQWESDPLARMELSPIELMQFQRFMNQNHDAAKFVHEMPVLILQGSKDHLVKPEGTIDLFNELTTHDKECLLIGSGEHLILEEGQFNDQVLGMISAWLNTHLVNAAGGSEGIAQAMIQARQKMQAAQYQEAAKVLQAVVNATPEDGEARLLLGEAYARTGNFRSAREHLAFAVAHGRGTPLARRANRIMMLLPKSMLAPRVGPGTSVVSKSLGITSQPNGATGDGKPVVLDFYASWCEPCKQVEQYIGKAKDRVGESVNFIRVDIDDKKNEDIVEQYDVSVIPTTVFLSSTGEVAAYNVGGFQTEQNFIQSMAKIISVRPPGMRPGGVLQGAGARRGPGAVKAGFTAQDQGTAAAAAGSTAGVNGQTNSLYGQGRPFMRRRGQFRRMLQEEAMRSGLPLDGTPQSQVQPAAGAVVDATPAAGVTE